MILRNRYLAASLAIAIASVSSPVMAQEVSGTLSGQVSEGDFGSDRDTTWASVVAGARWTSGDTSVQVTLPYIDVDSPGVVFSGFDGTPLVMLPDAGGARTDRSGVGDPTLSVSQDLAAGNFDLRATGRVKIPVQDFNDVSTGELDWSLSLEASRDIGAVTPFVAVGHRWYGNPEGWNIRDGFSASAGMGFEVAGGAAAISYEFAETTSDFIDDAHEVVAVYDAPIADRLRLASFATVGLSDGAADYGVGVRLAASF